MKRRFITILSAICLVLSMSLVAACSGCSKKPPKAGDGVVYQTGAQSFWVGVGQAYMTFENVAEPEQKEENALYGNVFYVRVSSDSGKTYSPWLSGKWEMSEEKTELTLTATWESGDNSTSLADATSGEAKKYTADGGKFTIGVNLPSAGKVNFTLDPVNDKVGEGETPVPPAECTEHIDANKDGKCDKCGKDMPTPPPASGEKEVQLTMKSEANEAGQIGRILMYGDNTWEFSVCFYGDTYNPMASGTWAIRQDYSAMDLTVTNDEANILGGNNIVVTMDASNPADIKYATTVNCNIPQVGELSFAMNKAANEEQPTPEPSTPSTPSDDTLKSEEASFWGGVGKAYIEFNDSDKTFAVKVNAGDGKFSPWLSGTYTLADNVLKLTATWDAQSAAKLTGGTSGEAKAYNANNGTYVIGVEVTQAGTVNFKFIPDPSAVKESAQYKVTFDMNYAGGAKIEIKTSTFEMPDGSTKQYIPKTDSPSLPQRTGYRFAGWDTSAAPVLENGASKTKFMLGSKIYDMGFGVDTSNNDVMEITEDITLYARWVKPTKVFSADDLKNMEKDLSGWYVMQNDITITGEWTPVGKYYTSYEWLDTGWWKYAFSGVFDGNGYSIKGLNVTTLMPYGDTSDPVDGTANGTTALFGAICDATITKVTIESPVINITNYSDKNHGYVSVLAAFVQGANTEINNVKVTNATIIVNTTNVAYISVSALLAGHWGGSINNSSATGTITVNAEYTADYNEGATNLYAGGLIGEGYCWVDNCKSEMTVNLNVKDARAAVTVTPPATAPVINAYMGAIGASAAYTANDIASGALNFDFHEVENTAVSAYVGGVAGIQRYGYLDYTTADTKINVITNTKEGNAVYIGSLLGGYDAITSVLYLHGTNNMKARLCTDAGVTVTKDGTNAEDVPFIGYAPKTAQEMATSVMIAQAVGVDLSPYLKDGVYDIYGTDRCVKLGE